MIQIQFQPIQLEKSIHFLKFYLHVLDSYIYIKFIISHKFSKLKELE